MPPLRIIPGRRSLFHVLHTLRLTPSRSRCMMRPNTDGRGDPAPSGYGSETERTSRGIAAQTTHFRIAAGEKRLYYGPNDACLPNDEGRSSACRGMDRPATEGTRATDLPETAGCLSIPIFRWWGSRAAPGRQRRTLCDLPPGQVPAPRSDGGEKGTVRQRERSRPRRPDGDISGPSPPFGADGSGNLQFCHIPVITLTPERLVWYTAH